MMTSRARDSDKSPQSATRATRASHARAVKRQLPLAIIVGDTDGSALVSSQIAEGFKRRDVDAAIQVRSPQRASTVEKIEQRRRNQTTIGVGLAGPKADS